MSNKQRQINAEELLVFFKLIGSGIWYLQHVEDALSTYITVKAEIKDRGGTSAENAKFPPLPGKMSPLSIANPGA